MGQEAGSTGTRRTRLLGGETARSEALLQVLLVAGGAGLLAWPMVLNGFPLVFADSAWYLAPIDGGGAHPARTLGYSLFLAAPYWLGGLEAVVVLQAAVTSLLVVRVARAWAGGGVGVAALALLAVGLLSGAAKYASWIMADITTSWIFLGGVLWMLPTRLPDRILAVGCGGVALLAHNTHLPLAAAVGGALVVGAFVLLPRRHPGRRRALVLAHLVVAAVPVASLVNGAATGRSDAMRGASPFLLNSFADSGVLLETLETYCPDSGWTLCDHREQLAVLEGRGVDWLLFRQQRSPLFTDLDGWHSEEASRVVGHAFHCCLDTIATTTALAAWRQFWTIDSDDGLIRNTTGPMADFLRKRSVRRFAEFKLSDQGSRRPVRVLVHPFPERPLHAALLGLALVLAGVAWRLGERRAAALVALLLLMLAANASICALASTLHDRYQGRVAWLVPVAVVLVAHSAWPAIGARLPRGLRADAGPPRGPGT